MSIFKNDHDMRCYFERALGVLASCWAIWVLSVALTSYSVGDDRIVEPALSAEELAQLDAYKAQVEQAERERRLEEESSRREALAKERREREQLRLDGARQDVLLKEGWAAANPVE